METGRFTLGKWVDSWKSGGAKTITFLVTEDCNLACKYCYLSGKNNKKRMTFETARQCVDYVVANRRLFSEESVIWEFTGGEPFLEIELIDAICDYTKKKLYVEDHPWFESYRFSLSTNGLLYGEPRVQSFLRKNRSHLSVGLSVDGNKKKHDSQRVYPDGSGSYDDVVRNVPLWLQQFPGASSKATLSHECLPHIKESVVHLWELGISTVLMNTVFENVWEEGDDEILASQLRQLGDYIVENGLWNSHTCTLFTDTIGYPMGTEDNRNWCGAGKMMAVDCDGNFYPCNRFTGFSLNKKKPRIIGNYVDGIDTNKLRPFLVLDRFSQSTDECFRCDVARGCAWCTGLNYDESATGTIFSRATYHCKMHKARVGAVQEFWKKIEAMTGEQHVSGPA